MSTYEVTAIVATAAAAAVSVIVAIRQYLRARHSPAYRIMVSIHGKQEGEYRVNEKQADMVKKLLQRDERELRRATN